jgi:kynurenine formamidase
VNNAAPPAATGAAAATPLAGRVVDLGHALAATDPTWSGTPVYSWKAVASFAKDGYFAGTFSTEEHFGTHVDAPAHFAAGGLTVDLIPPDRLIRPGVVIDIRRQVLTSEDYRLTLADVTAFESAHGPIPAGAFVCVATGWDSRWPDAARYMNVRGGVKHFPGLSVEAAKYLASERKVAAIGIDTGSIDYGLSEKFEAHQATMAAGLYHVESMTGLTSLPATGFTVVTAPIKIAGGSGGPARVFAILP